MSEEKVSRRGYVKYAAAGVVVIAGAAAGGYYATRPRVREPVDIEWGIWSWGVELVQDNARIFNENNPDINVRVGDYGLDTYGSGLATAYAGGNPPDLHYSTPDITISYQNAKQTVDMVDHYPEIENYVDDIIEGYRSGLINPFTGKMYGLFYYSGGHPFTYNKRHLEEAGIGDEPPKTWEELIDYSKTIQNKGITDFPLGFFAGSWGFVECAIYGILLTLTEEDPPFLFDEDLNPKFNYKGSPLFNGIKAVADAIHVDKVATTACVQYDEPTTVDVMGSGKHSFIWMPDYELAFINPPGASAEAGNLKYAVSPGPTGRISSIYRTYLTPSTTLDKGREYMDATWRLMQFTGGRTTDTKPDPNGSYFVVKRIAMEAGLAMPYKSMWDDQEIMDSISGWCEPQMRREVLSRVYDFFNDPKMTPWWDPWFGYWLAGAVRPKVHSLWLGEQGTPPSDDTILGVLNDIADEWTKMKQEAGM